MSLNDLFDWQNWVTLGIGLIALVYLVRRWGPSWRALWQRPEPVSTDACERGTSSARAPSSACGSGCGGCGAVRTPKRDHRITVVSGR